MGWGGKRKGSGRKNKAYIAKEQREREERNNRARLVRERQQERAASQTEADTNERNEADANAYEESLAALHQLAQEAERRIRTSGGACGTPGVDYNIEVEDDGDDFWDGDDSDWEEDSYEEESEDEDGDEDFLPEDSPVVDVGPGGGGGNPTQQHKKKKVRKRYKPPRGSQLDQYLVAMGETIKNDVKAGRGKHWYLPESDPAADKSGKPEPVQFYRARVSCFNWTPFTSYCKIVGNLQKDYECIHCHKKCLVSNGYYWRAAFDFDRLVYVRHRRVRCSPKIQWTADVDGKLTVGKGCGKSFAEFHPDFLTQMPTRVVETLPFLTRPKGPLMSTNMMYAFMELAEKGIMFGTFAAVFNTLYRIQHTTDHIAYVEAVKDARDANDRLGITSVVPAVFAPFHSPGEYNGIELQPSLVQYFFYRTCKALADYHQTSFQTVCDEGVIPDHTHQFARGIKIPGRPGHPFTASYTVLGLNSLVNLSPLTHTKSNEEIKGIIKKYKQVRINSGAPKIGRLESDGGGDRHLWPVTFPELKDGRAPYVPPLSDSLIKAGISTNDYIFFNDRTAANDWAIAVYKGIAESNDDIDIVFDMEWPRSSRGGEPSTSRSLQLLIHNKRSKDNHLVFLDLWEMNAYDSNSFPQAVRDLLLYNKATLAAHNAGNDVARLRTLGVELTRWIDTQSLAALVSEKDRAPSFKLDVLCAHHLFLDIDKSGQNSDWTIQPLPQSMIQYGLIDVIVTHKLLYFLRALVESERSASNTTCQQAGFNDLKPGTTAVMKSRNRNVAIVEIVSVGGAAGQQFKWGTTTIGKGKAIVLLKRVLVESTRAPMAFTPTVQQRLNGMKGWGGRKSRPGQKKYQPNIKLKDILALDQPAHIGVLQSSLHINLDISIGPSFASEQIAGDRQETSETADLEQDTHSTEGSIHQVDEDDSKSVETSIVQARDSNDNNQETAGATSCPINTDLVDGGVDEEEWGVTTYPETAPRSREKSDIFHWFQNLPGSLNCPGRPVIMQLLIIATYHFDEEEYVNVTEHLRQHLGIITLEEILNHFFFNRDWWGRRVPAYTSKADKHGDDIDLIRHFCTKELKEYYTHEQDEYLKKLARWCREGHFEEVLDISMYQYDGVDSFGLRLYLRKRGSSKTENFHQKLAIAFGAWSIGAQTGHFLMVLVAYRYNVRTAIRRCNAHDFGHTHLHLIDRLDLLIQDIWGVRLYPRHTNVSLFEGVQDFVSVGITPLSCDDRFVKRGSPDPRLRGQNRFMAEMQGVECSPFPVAKYEEHKMLNQFLQRHPKPSQAEIEQLCIEYLNRTNCTTILPKLPSHICTAIKKARDTHLIRKLQSEIKAPLYSLMAKLAVPVERPFDGIIDREEDDIPEDVANCGGPIARNSSTNEIASGNAAQMPLPRQHVPPLAAPHQAAVVATRTGSGGNRCFYRPFCTARAAECGGIKSGSCNRVNNGLVKIPDKEVFLAAKAADIKKEKADREAQRRAENKKQKRRRIE